jgi:soluble lytic murein transglycosylase
MLWDLSRLLMRTGREEEALEFIEELARDPDLDYRSTGLFWATRLHHRAGRTTEANRYASELNATLPLSYHGYRARAIDPAIGEAPTGVGRREPLRAGEFPAGLWDTAQHSADPVLRRVATLRGLGRHDWCCAELAWVLEADPESREAAALYVSSLMAKGELPLAVRRAHEFFKGELLAGDSGLPIEVWDAAYPLAYRQEIESAAIDAGLDPFFLTALASRESSFDPRARSAAGAVGLTQLIPPTARALLRKERRPYHAGILTDPAENLRLGAKYLASLMKGSPDGQEVALAGYNAGPVRADEWWRILPRKDTDLFVDTIPFLETRVYVKGVLRVYWEYVRIYRGMPASPPGPAWPATTTPSTPQGVRAR